MEVHSGVVLKLERANAAVLTRWEFLRAYGGEFEHGRSEDDADTSLIAIRLEYGQIQGSLEVQR